MDEGDRDATGDADVDALLDDLARWMGDERARDGADARARRRWLHQQAAESATFVGLALDLAERGASVAIRTASGAVHQGRIVAVGNDFLVVRADGPAVVIVASASVTSIRPVDGAGLAPEATGDRRPPRPMTMEQVLGGLAGTRRLVRIVSAGGEDIVTGELRAVGEDVVTVRLDGQPPATAYVRLGSVEACTVFGSG